MAPYLDHTWPPSSPGCSNTSLWCGHRLSCSDSHISAGIRTHRYLEGILHRVRQNTCKWKADSYHFWNVYRSVCITDLQHYTSYHLLSNHGRFSIWPADGDILLVVNLKDFMKRNPLPMCVRVKNGKRNRLERQKTAKTRHAWSHRLRRSKCLKNPEIIGVMPGIWLVSCVWQMC